MCAAVPLGFDISVTPRQRAGRAGVQVHVKAVGASGLAATSSAASRLRVGDRVLEVNGKKMSRLPPGSAGRIYLFRLLASDRLELKARTTKTVVGFEDVSAGAFTPMTVDST